MDSGEQAGWAGDCPQVISNYAAKSPATMVKGGEEGAEHSTTGVPDLTTLSPCPPSEAPVIPVLPSPAPSNAKAAIAEAQALKGQPRYALLDHPLPPPPPPPTSPPPGPPSPYVKEVTGTLTFSAAPPAPPSRSQFRDCERQYTERHYPYASAMPIARRRPLINNNSPARAVIENTIANTAGGGNSMSSYFRLRRAEGERQKQQQQVTVEEDYWGPEGSPASRAHEPLQNHAGSGDGSRQRACSQSEEASEGEDGAMSPPPPRQRLFSREAPPSLAAIGRGADPPRDRLFSRDAEGDRRERLFSRDAVDPSEPTLQQLQQQVEHDIQDLQARQRESLEDLSIPDMQLPQWMTGTAEQREQEVRARAEFLGKLMLRRPPARVPSSEPEFHAARYYDDGLGKSVYDVEQWVDYLMLMDARHSYGDEGGDEGGASRRGSAVEVDTGEVEVEVREVRVLARSLSSGDKLDDIHAHSGGSGGSASGGGGGSSGGGEGDGGGASEAFLSTTEDDCGTGRRNGNGNGNGDGDGSSNSSSSACSGGGSSSSNGTERSISTGSSSGDEGKPKRRSFFGRSDSFSWRQRRGSKGNVGNLFFGKSASTNERDRSKQGQSDHSMDRRKSAGALLVADEDRRVLLTKAEVEARAD